MIQPETIILTKTQIDHKIMRIAYQVYEANVNEELVVVAGIKENGYLFAKKIKSILEKISPLKVILCEVIIDKKKTNQSHTNVHSFF